MTNLSMHKVTFKKQGVSFPSKDGQSILKAAVQAQVHFLVSCRNGSCRTCMCQIESGKVRYDIEWPSLSKEEKNEAWILPCVAIAESDVVVCL